MDKIFGGAIPKNYVPSVEKGVRQAVHDGIVAGYPLMNIRVTVVDGSYHEVDSSDMAFQIAGSIGFKAAADLALRAACYAVPTHNPHGFNHMSLWPAALDDFRPGERGDDLRIAAAYLLLEIEQIEAKPAEKAD